MSSDRRDDQPTFITQEEFRTKRSDVVGGLRRVPVVAASRKAGRLTSGIDTPHLHRKGAEPGDAQHENNHQRGDGERRLDGGGAAIAG